MAPGTHPGRAGNIALWIVQGLLALAFLAAGASKLAGVPMMVKSFDLLGLGQWFRYLTGGLEVLSAILLLIPSFSGIGALLLCGVMVGAVVAHLTRLGESPAVPLVLLALAGIVAWGRRGVTIHRIQGVLSGKETK